jgi:predicted small secreted protein
MKTTILMMVGAAAVCLMNSCGTIKGFGNDVQRAGGAISDTASRAAN